MPEIPKVAGNREDRTTNRRTFLTVVGGAGTVGLAGCLGDATDDDESDDIDDDDPGFAEPEEPDEYREVQELRYWGVTESRAPDKKILQDLVYETLSEELGLNINYEVMAHSEMGDLALEQEFELVGISWEGRVERMDPQALLSLFGSDLADPGNPNIGAYRDDEYDEILGRIAETVDPEERREYVYDAQRKLHEDQPAIFVYHPHRLSVSDTRNWSNHTARQAGIPYWNVEALSELEADTDDRSFVHATLRDVTHFNSMEWTSTPTARNLILNYDPLVRFDRNAEPMGAAAADWEVVDSLTIEVTLREGMTFHDGEPVTPEDVKFTYEYHMEWGTEKIERFYERIDNIEILDSQTLRFNYAEPDAGYVVGFNQVWILPEHIWDGVADEFDVDHPRSLRVPEDVPAIGSGPFKLEYHAQEDRTILEVFDDYYVDMDPEQIIWNHFGSSSAAFGSLETGDVHHMAEVEPGDFERAEEDDNLLAEGVPTIGFTPVHTHTEHEPTDDVTVRQAMAHAIDYDEIIAVATRGNADVSTSPISPANEFWHNSDLEPYTGGPGQARKMLYDAGYRWDEDQNLLKPRE